MRLSSPSGQFVAAKNFSGIIPGCNPSSAARAPRQARRLVAVAGDQLSGAGGPAAARARESAFMLVQV